LVHLVLFFIIGLVAVISDRLFIVMFCVPFTGALFVFALKKKNYKKLLYLFGLMAAYVILGFILFDRITHNKVITLAKASFNFSIEGMSIAWRNFASGIAPYLSSITTFTIIIIISGVALLLALILFFRSVKKLLKGLEIDSEEGLRNFLNLFFIIFMVVVFLSPILTGSFQGFDTIRYNIFVLYFGLLFIGPLFVMLFNERPFAKVVISSLSYVFVALSIVYIVQANVDKAHGNGIKSYIGYYPEVAKCLDAMDEKYELKQGISTYWFGKVGTMFSKRNVRLYTAYDENLVPYPHVGNINWYYESGYGKYDPPIFNFVLLKLPIDQQTVLKTIEEKTGKILFTEEYGEFLFIKTNDFKYERDNYFPIPILTQNP